MLLLLVGSNTRALIIGARLSIGAMPQHTVSEQDAIDKYVRSDRMPVPKVAECEHWQPGFYLLFHRFTRINLEKSFSVLAPHTASKE